METERKESKSDMNFVSKEQNNMNLMDEMRTPEDVTTCCPPLEQNPALIRGYGIKPKVRDKNPVLPQELLKPVSERSTFDCSSLSSSSDDCSDGERSYRKQSTSSVQGNVTTAPEPCKTDRGGTCIHRDDGDERETTVVSEVDEDDESDEAEESNEDDEETDESHEGKEDLGEGNYESEERNNETQRSAVDSADSIVYKRQVSDQNQAESSGACNIQHEKDIFLDLCARDDGGKRSNAKAIRLYKKGSHDRAIHEFKWAAKNCHNNSAYYNLGLCFQGKQDFTKAIRYYEVAANEDHAEANYNIAYIILNYRTKLTTKFSESDGIRFLEKAAGLGLMQAQTQLGIILMEKKENADTARKAAQLFELAARQKCPKAIYHLGICYEKGLGVQVNSAKAADLYARASHSQYPEAQHNLGVFFEWGSGGLTENKAEAMNWYKKAVQNGHQESAYDVERLERMVASKDEMTVVAEYATDAHSTFQNRPSMTKGVKVSTVLPVVSEFDNEDVLPSPEME